MHTFFINASSRRLNEYDILFDIQVENKTFVSMDCPMAVWYDTKKGYSACIRKMSDMIEGNVELNNAFDLIIYVDLPENTLYSSFKRDEFNDVKREECKVAMKYLYTHIVYKTIVSELTETGRTPQSVLLMIGEEKEYLNFGNEKRNPTRPAVMERTLGFLGFPTFEEIEEIAKEVDAGGEKDKAKKFAEKIFPICKEEIVPGIREQYKEELDRWCSTLMYSGDVTEANNELFDAIEKINVVESGRLGIECISCRYDSFACRVNRSVCALSSLNIAIHLLKCIEAKGIYVSESASGDTRELMEFHSYSLDEIVPILKSKSSVYNAIADEIDVLAKLYTKLNLAPPLKEFDYSKFGLDGFGDLAVELKIQDAKPADEEKKEKEESDKGVDDRKEGILQADRKEIVITQKERKLLFKKDEYAPLDMSSWLKRDQVIKHNATPEQYLEYSKKLRLLHLNYVKIAKRHVTEVLSNYAGKSKENKPALLRMGGERYALSSQESNIALETSANLANQSYKTMFKQYVEFCAGRSVAITDIQEQCDWFVTRIEQITRSLKLLKRVAVGIGIGIIALYLPYIIIQFEAIFKNIFTISAALASLGLPVVILYAVFGALAAIQRRQYSKAYDDFEKKSDEVLKENREAIQEFDQLLASIIPGLRWVYEYKLDVQYCAECCEIADAKIEHHRKKLRARIMAIVNILRDLEVEMKNSTERANDFDLLKVIDFNVPYCSGKMNCELYSIIGRSILNQHKE